MEDAMDTYARVKYLVQNDIRNAIEEDKSSRVFSAFNLPQHAHTGTDSSPVEFTNLNNFQYYVNNQTFVLTSAQILALHTTPLTIVRNVGPLSVIIVEGITARLVYGGTQYTGANALEFRYTDASGTKVTTDIGSAFIDSASSAFAYAPAVTAAFTPVAGGSGTNGNITVSVPSANPGAGNSTITLIVKYRIVPFNS